MKKWLKISLIIFLVLFLLILAVAAITAYQIKQIVDIVKESDSLEQDYGALMSGDCTKLESIELKFNDITTKIKNACLNPIIRIVIEKTQPENNDFCLLIDRQKNDFDANLTSIKEYCSK